MAQQIQIDLDELNAFISALKSFNGKLDGDWQQLKGRWRSLRQTWNDSECDKFLDSQGWLDVQVSMERYLAEMRSHVFWLEQKA